MVHTKLQTKTYHHPIFFWKTYDKTPDLLDIRKKEPEVEKTRGELEYVRRKNLALNEIKRAERNSGKIDEKPIPRQTTQIHESSESNIFSWEKQYHHDRDLIFRTQNTADTSQYSQLAHKSEMYSLAPGQYQVDLKSHPYMSDNKVQLKENLTGSVPIHRSVRARSAYAKLSSGYGV